MDEREVERRGVRWKRRGQRGVGGQEGKEEKSGREEREVGWRMGGRGVEGSRMKQIEQEMDVGEKQDKGWMGK